MILEGFQHLLANAEAVTAIVGTRIYYQQRVQRDQLPAIVLQLANDDQGHAMAGPRPHSFGFVRVTCLAATPAAASDLSAAARVVLNGYRGEAGPIHFGFIVTRGETDVPTSTPEGQARPDTYGVLFDAHYMHHHSQE